MGKTSKIYSEITLVMDSNWNSIQAHLGYTLALRKLPSGEWVHPHPRSASGVWRLETNVMFLNNRPQLWHKVHLCWGIDHSKWITVTALEDPLSKTFRKSRPVWMHRCFFFSGPQRARRRMNSTCLHQWPDPWCFCSTKSPGLLLWILQYTDFYLFFGSTTFPPLKC